MTRTWSTEHVPVEKGFKLMQEATREVFGRSQLSRLSDEPFHARIDTANVADIVINRCVLDPIRNVISAEDRRTTRAADHLILKVTLSGKEFNDQLGHACVLQPGDMCVVDDRYERVSAFPVTAAASVLTIPRESLERRLGPARHYAGLKIEAASPGASLVRTFLADLARVHDRFSPETAARMTGIGIDLIAASIAERTAREPTGSVRDTALVQRAKAYVEANLGDPALDPPRLAAAMAVSLRHLQRLFHDRGRGIADWIWERRLQNAAQRLADPACAHLPIGVVAYGCGFSNQAHFSRRFRERFGTSPRERRRATADPGHGVPGPEHGVAGG